VLNKLKLIKGTRFRIQSLISNHCFKVIRANHDQKLSPKIQTIIQL